ncbi:hypothetical protein BC827DRAFT_923268 [Russula dissimulans]|nr:hypothetical protein BC827DRAFT_923268 [Russula dissimulans]
MDRARMSPVSRVSCLPFVPLPSSCPLALTPSSPLKTDLAPKTCSSPETPSDSLLGRCQNVVLLAVPQNSRSIPSWTVLLVSPSAFL